MFLKRTITPQILDALGHSPAVFLSGPRQAGKSTLVQSLTGRDWPADYVTFDEASQLGAAQQNPETFLRGYDGPLILDEVQMAPELFRGLKILIDEARSAGESASGRYLLTGSANVMALPRLADALVGRIRVLTLYPLSAVEVTGSGGGFPERLFANRFKAGREPRNEDLARVFQRSSFPEILDFDASTRRHWFESYMTTILQRDVRQIADIEKLGVLPNLLRVLAGRAGGLINETDLGRSIGQNAVTTKNYRILLRMMFLTFDVKPWFRNTGKRLVKSGKGYLTDTSLLCHLLHVDPGKAARRDPDVFGHILENFVASELVKQLAFSDISCELFHYRTSDNKEVDFVLEQPGGKLAAIEVKSRDAVAAEDFKGIKDLASRTGDDFACGVVLYRGASTIAFGDKLWAVPVHRLWED